jgi:hypothetical protein
MKTQNSQLKVSMSEPGSKGSVDLSPLFDGHIERKFADQDVKATMETTVPEPYVEAFINDADEALAKSSYDSLSPEPYQPHCDKLDLERLYATQIPKSYLNGTEDNALPQGAKWGWHPRMSSCLGLFRLVQMPGSHEVIVAKTPRKIDHRLLRPFLPGLDDRIPGASAQFSTEGRTQWRIFQPSV